MNMPHCDGGDVRRCMDNGPPTMGCPQCDTCDNEQWFALFCIALYHVVQVASIDTTSYKLMVYIVLYCIVSSCTSCIH